MERPLTARWIELSAGAAVAGSALAAFNGVPRFDLAQLATATGIASVAVGMWFAGSRRAAVAPHPLSAWFLVPLVLLAARVGAGAWLADHGDAFDQVALIALPLTLGVVTALPLSGSRVAGAMLAGAGVATVVASLASAAQTAGIAWPRPIPWDEHLAGGARGTFDDPAIAGVWFAAASMLGAELLRRARQAGVTRAANRARVAFGWVVVQAAGIGAGLTGSWVAVASVCLGAAAALLGIVTCRDHGADAGRGPRLLLAPLLAVAAFFVAPGPRDTTVDALAARPRVSELARGREWPYGADGAVAHYRRAAWAYAAENQPWGAGPAGFPAHAAAVDDDATEFATESRPLPAARHAPSALLELAGDLGAGAAVALLWAWCAALWAARRGGRWEACGALATVLFALALSPGALSAAAFAIAAAAAAVAFEPSPGAPTRGRPLPALAVVPIAVIALAAQIHAAAWGRAAAGAAVFLGHARLEDAAAWSERATGIQRRYQSEFNAALALELKEPERDRAEELADGAEVSALAADGSGGGGAPGGEQEEARPEPEAIGHWEAAVALRPSDPSARLHLAELYLRDAIGRPDQDERLARGARMLERVIALSPNHGAAVRMRANAQVALGDASAALDTLDAFLDRPIPAEARLRAALQQAQIAEDELEDPRRALTALRIALELNDEERLEGDLEVRAGAMERWLESGTRPVEREAGHHR